MCADCHEQQAVQWTGSHHDLAVQRASAATVLGNFDNARLTHFGVSSSFYKLNKSISVWKSANGRATVSLTQECLLCEPKLTSFL